MNKEFRQEFSIKTIPTDDTLLLENTLNAMSQSGWELYSIYEVEQNSKLLYNCIFVKEVSVSLDEASEEILNFRSTVERMLYPSEEPYTLCINIQKKIRDKKEKIERVKKFLENSKDEERELLNEEIRKDIDELNNLKRDLKEVLAPSKMSRFLGEEKLSISLSDENYCLCDPANEKNLLSQTVKVRQNLTQELGYIIPKVQFIENSSLDEFEFSIDVHGVSVISAKAYPGHKGFFEEELNLDKPPKNAFKTRDTLTKRRMLWIKDEECKDYWVEGICPTEYIVEYLSYCAIAHVDEIFDYSDLNRYVEFVNERNEFLVDSILGDFISISELKYLLVQLIRERVSIKDINLIFEKLNDFSDDPNKTNLLDKLRASLSRQICSTIANKNKEIFAYELSDELLRMLDNKNEHDEIDVKFDIKKMLEFKELLEETHKDAANQNVVFLVSQEKRQLFFALLTQFFADIPVICNEEIADGYKLRILGRV